MTRAQLIISIAKQYIGQKEKPGNSGFQDAAFQKLMVAAGWLTGQAWCAYFVKMVWKQAYANSATLLGVVTRMCNGGALMTLNNHKSNGTFTVSKIPVPGAIAIWMHGNGPQGHAGLVISVTGDTMETIEGNTNAAGGREGDTVAIKKRPVNFARASGQLNLVGFIHPKED